ncbi:MAG TPA: XdhC family protein [Capsulimonadaceae bacterium]|nr:XdhC family protein [Capsulimonadaceae bacterium]
MKELATIVAAWEKARREKKSAALATVVKVTGSAYRREGARMLVTAGGETYGCVSGGCLEADVRERALKLLANPSAPAELAVYDMTDENDILFGTGAGCQGIVEVLIERLPDSDSYLGELYEILSRNETAVLATVFRVSGECAVQPGEHLLIAGKGRAFQGSLTPALAERVLPDARKARAAGQSRSGIYAVGQGEASVLIEVIAPPVQMVIFGAGPGALPLARMAHELGWRVALVDYRPAYVSREHFPLADQLILARPEEIAAKVPISSNTAAVVMTHSFLHDQEILRALLGSPARYIGLLSSRSRCRRLLTQLPAELTHGADRLHAPIGLDIGAETPEMIALSILAEIQSVWAGRQGGSLCGK